MSVRSVATDIRVIFNWLAEEPKFHWTLREMAHIWSDGRVERGNPRPLNRVARGIERVTTAAAVGGVVWGLAAEGIASAIAAPLLFMGAGWLMGGVATFLIDAMEERAKNFETWAIGREYRKNHKEEIREQKAAKKLEQKQDKAAWDKTFEEGSFYKRMAMRFHKLNQPFKGRYTITTGIKKLLMMETPDEVRSKLSRVVERVGFAAATIGMLSLVSFAGPGFVYPFLITGAWIIGESLGRGAQFVGEFAEGYFNRKERLRVEALQGKPTGPVTTPYSMPNANGNNANGNNMGGDTLDMQTQVTTFPDGRQVIMPAKLSQKFWEEAADSRNMGELPPVQNTGNNAKPPANSR